MPSVQIDIRREYTPEQELAIINAVHTALVMHFKIPEKDKNVRLISHLPHRFLCPVNLDSPEYYTNITIDAFTGRSIEAKRHLYQGIVNNLELLGIPRLCVFIVLREHIPENWGIRGGQAACDVALGFNVDV